MSRYKSHKAPPENCVDYFVGRDFKNGIQLIIRTVKITTKTFKHNAARFRPYFVPMLPLCETANLLQVL
jgi:hypothetical protein